MKISQLLLRSDCAINDNEPRATFAALFREGQKMDPLDNGKFARSKAHEVLSVSGIAFTDDAVPISTENGATIGVAFYSRPDLDLLDQIVFACHERSLAGFDVPSLVIFDVLGCNSMADFERFIPGIGSVYQTPVVGIWENGQVVEKGTGAKGRMLLTKSQYSIRLNTEQP